jgi:hypothetical protein
VVSDVLYLSAVRHAMRGNLDFDTDTFYAMLLTDAYTPVKTDEFRSSVTSAEVTGTGYTAGGKAITVSVGAVDTGTDSCDITLGPVEWTGLTVAAFRSMVVYKRRGGTAAADELVFCRDYGSDASVTSGTLTLEACTIPVTIG